MNPYRRLVSFWDSDRSLTALLAFLLLMIFILPGIAAFHDSRNFVLGVLMTLMLLAGIRVASKNRSQVILLSIFVVVAIGTRTISYWAGGQFVFILRSVSHIVSLAILATVVMIQIFRKGPITIHRIQGAVAEYLLLGLIDL